MMMRRRLVRSSCAGYRKGLSLIEVVAGTALAGTLLVGILLAMSAYNKQLRRLQLGKAGVKLIDRMLSTWALHDFGTDHLDKVAEEVGTPIVWNNQPSNSSFDANSDLVIHVTSQRLPELQVWSMERVQVEAISTVSGDSVAQVEIVRHAP